MSARCRVPAVRGLCPKALRKHGRLSWSGTIRFHVRECVCVALSSDPRIVVCCPADARTAKKRSNTPRQATTNPATEQNTSPVGTPRRMRVRQREGMPARGLRGGNAPTIQGAYAVLTQFHRNPRAASCLRPSLMYRSAWPHRVPVVRAILYRVTIYSDGPHPLRLWLPL